MASGFLLKRAFSTGSVFRQTVQLPTQVHGVEGKYAAALYTSACKQKTLDNVNKDLIEVRSLYNSHEQFKLFIENPTLNRHKKRAALEGVLQKLGVSSEIKNFFDVLAENGRLNKINNIFNSFESLMRAHRGELFVDVTSAEPLSKKHEQALSSALQSFAKSGQKLHINYTVKPNILGGLIVTIGDKYVDLSIATRFKKIQTALNSAI